MFKGFSVVLIAGGLSMTAVDGHAQTAQAPAERIFENLSLFVGPDGSKQPQDLGINANMGIRFAANLGFPLFTGAKIGAQVGAAHNISDAAVHVLDQIEGTSGRTQTFLTAGVFRRAGGKVNWGVGYDLLFQRYYDDFRLGQLRGEIGYAVGESNEVGVWATRAAGSDSGVMGTTPVHLTPISQMNGFLRHTWASNARTNVWVGFANAHHNVVWVFEDNSKDDNVLVYGAELSVPLSERFSISGAANFVTPTATGTVDAYLGLTFFPGKSAIRSVRNVFAPFTSVANNPTFAVDLRR
jgi:hypothetical protein